MTLDSFTQGLQEIAGRIGGKAPSDRFVNALWSFEIWDEDGPMVDTDSPSNPYIFAFRWPPTDFRWEPSLRADVQLDLAGLPATTHLGQGLGRMSLSGSHGVGIQGKTASQDADGFSSRESLRKLFDLWEELVHQANIDSKPYPRLVLAIRNGGATEWKNREFHVWPLAMPNDERTAARPLEWSYSISLWVLGEPQNRKAPVPAPAGAKTVSLLDQVLATIDSFNSRVRQVQAVAKKVKVTVQAVRNVIAAGRGAILSNLEHVHLYLGDMANLQEDILRLRNLASLNADVKNKLSKIQRDLSDISGGIKRMLDEDIKTFGVRSKARKPRSASSPQTAAPLLTVAQNDLGDSARWKEIATLNKVPFPYRPEGLLKLPVDTPETPEASALDPIGTDLDPAGRKGVLVGGAQNLVTAVLRRLRTPRGYLPHEPEYGSLLHRFIGKPFDVATALAVRGEVERTILEDQRVTRVASLSVAASDALDAFDVRAEVECVFGYVQIAGEITSDAVVMPPE